MYARRDALDLSDIMEKSEIIFFLLGSRPTVGHMTLDHGIGVRIPASQPA